MIYLLIRKNDETGITKVHGTFRAKKVASWVLSLCEPDHGFSVYEVERYDEIPAEFKWIKD